MSLPALRQFVLPPLIASAAVFSVMSSPLAVLGDKPVNIWFEEEPIFDGRLRDIAPPYVGLVTLLSFGAGITAAAVSGWRNSTRRSGILEHQVAELEESLTEKDGLLRELKLSESRIQISGLTGFLDEEVPFDRAIANDEGATSPVSQPVVAQTPPVVKTTTIQPTKVAMNLPENRHNGHGRVASAASVTSGFASAQTFMRYAPNQSNTDLNHSKTSSLATSVTPQEFEELQQQMRLMMEKMQQMQNNFQNVTPLPVATTAAVNDKFQVYYESPSQDEAKYM